ncbi:hypothetical protein UCCLB556_pA0030 (plasmid) [Levilactobacillus brevis]|nr:hypothetical protein UCCLB556_pA0030 [Levilactobacillus brevis]
MKSQNFTPLGKTDSSKKDQQEPVWDNHFNHANGWLASLGGTIITRLLVLILLEIVAQICGWRVN